MKRLAIIPVRMGSKRLPKKNIREFFGKPLFLYSIDNARESGLFDEIHVSTESDLVISLSEQHGLHVPFKRAGHLASDTAQLQQVCEYVLEEYEKKGRLFDSFCILWATAPLRKPQDIVEAYKLLTPEVEAVVSVTDYDLPVFCAQRIEENGDLDPVFPEMLRLPGNKMPRVVCDNGNLCWVKKEAFWEHRTWLPPKTKGYWIPKHRSVDIDNEDDWMLAEYCYKRYILGETG